METWLNSDAMDVVVSLEKHIIYEETDREADEVMASLSMLIPKFYHTVFPFRFRTCRMCVLPNARPIPTAYWA